MGAEDAKSFGQREGVAIDDEPPRVNRKYAAEPTGVEPVTVSEGVSGPMRRIVMQLEKKPPTQGNEYDKPEPSMRMNARIQGCC